MQRVMACISRTIHVVQWPGEWQISLDTFYSCQVSLHFLQLPGGGREAFAAVSPSPASPAPSCSITTEISSHMLTLKFSQHIRLWRMNHFPQPSPTLTSRRRLNQLARVSSPTLIQPWHLVSLHSISNSCSHASLAHIGDPVMSCTAHQHPRRA
jgi:hypothetical protein